MKVLFDHQLPFSLAHGGLAIQITKTKEALQKAGVDVEYLRWWDNKQKGDIIHFFGRAHPSHIEFAHAKGIKYVMSELLSSQGSRTLMQLRLQAAVQLAIKAITPPVLLDSLRWGAHSKVDATIVLTNWEAKVASVLFGPPSDKLFVIPNGVETEFFNTSGLQVERSDELLCVATIRPLKRVLDLAEAAILARVPVRFIGAPYGESDPYYNRFLDVCTRAPEFARYSGPLSARNELAERYVHARGFVLLSTMESLSLSALEAAASGCPLLLSDLPWAHCTFGPNATYCPISSVKTTARFLRTFHDNAPSLPIPVRPFEWQDVADQLIAVYRRVC